MSTVKKLVHGMEKKYVVHSVLSPICMIGEVVMEIFIPLVMSKIIDVGIANSNLAYVIKTGLLMIGIACVSFTSGVNLSIKFIASFGSMFIFQFPAITFFLIISSLFILQALNTR